MKTQKTSQKINGALTIVIVAAILVVINFLSYQIFSRVDLTANKNYSLSATSKKTVSDLDDLVTVKAYLSKNLPIQYLNLEQEIEDMLREYQNYSKGKFSFKVISPESDSSSMEDLANQGIPALQFNTVENDSFQVINGYLGLIAEYGGKTEVIPVVDSVSGLEYKMTSIIKKLTAQSMPTLGIASGNGEYEEDAMKSAFAALREIYTLKTIDLSSEENIGADISSLLILGPKEKFSEDQLKKIDKFIVSGRPAIFLVDGVSFDQSTGAKQNILDINKLFNSWGVNLNGDLVADISNGRASFSSNRGGMNFSYMMNYPLWPKILPENINKDNPIVSGLKNLVFPWVSSLTISPVNGLAVSELLKTTNYAWNQVDNYNVDPSGLVAPKNGKQYSLGVALTGKIKSAFDQGETENGKVAIISDSDFATDNFVSGNSSDNLILFQNLVDGLSLDSDLISIRSKAGTDSPIKAISNSAKEAIRYANIFALAVVVLVFGFLRYFLRRRSKNKI